MILSFIDQCSAYHNLTSLYFIYILSLLKPKTSDARHIVYAFEKDQCRKTCEQYQKEASHADKRTYTSWVEMGSTDCIRYAKCKAGHHFTPKGSPTHKYCKREKRHNRSHKRSCSKYTQGKSYTARLNYVTNHCMKQCDPGDGETPLGICNKKAELRFKISDIFDHFQAIMDKVAGFILTASECAALLTNLSFSLPFSLSHADSFDLPFSFFFPLFFSS